MSTHSDDPDKQVLAELASHGIDMSQPILFEFAFDVPDEVTANAIATALGEAGYETESVYDEGELEEGEEATAEELEEFGPCWTVYAKIKMLPRYDELMRVQASLDEIARPLGGALDGWEVQVG